MGNDKIAFLFPGQGSQYIGMGSAFVDQDSEAAILMDKAESISGYAIKKLCFEGPMEELTRTAYLQPAMTVVDLICLQALKKQGVRPDYVAGHSLGEYSAMCAAGILSVEDTLALVTERGKLMEREAEKNPGGMVAVIGLAIDEVREVVDTAAAKGKITAANHNAEKQIVVSGAKEALAYAGEVVAEKGGKAIPLKVSGAWHSDLVAGAIGDFQAFMETIDFKIPDVSVFFNVTADEENDPAGIRDIMARQIASTVRWYEIMQKLMECEVRIFIEVGPKNVLSGLAKKIIPSDYKYKCLRFDTPETLEKCLQEI